MMTNKEIGSAVKGELKEAGYSSKTCSVSVRDCGYSTMIRVKVKSPYVNRAEIEKLLNHWRDVDVDERTQETLMGGNTYLLVEYEHDVFSEVAKEWTAFADILLERKEETVKIYDSLYLIKSGNSLVIRQCDEKVHVTRECSYDTLCIYLFKYNQFGTILT